MGTTLITDLREPVRAVLGDYGTATIGATKYRYADNAVDMAIRTAFRVGKLPGYALATGNLAITPELLTPRAWGMATYESAVLLLTPNMPASAFRMRALAESYADQRMVLQALHDECWAARNGGANGEPFGMMASRLSLASWIRSMTGLCIWRELTEHEQVSPLWTTVLTAAGLQTGGSVTTGSSGSDGSDEPAEPEVEGSVLTTEGSVLTDENGNVLVSG